MLILSSETNQATTKKHISVWLPLTLVLVTLSPEQKDDRFDYGEIRIYAIGLIKNGDLVEICHAKQA